MKYLEDVRFTQLTSDLTEAFLNTRGSGNGAPASSSGRMSLSRGRGGGSGNKAKKHQQSHSQHQQQRAKKSSSSPYLPTSSFAYNPEGYSSYDNGTSSSSCRVIYGRVEAYTTKRAGSDKKTAYQVGENYAHEMEKLNEAVESMKRERRSGNLSSGGEQINEGVGAAMGKRMKKDKQNNNEGRIRRPRSRSVDVTFAESASLTPLKTLMEHSPLVDDTIKRPREGILKEPSSSNKRSR
jgi:hypothetical protein